MGNTPIDVLSQPYIRGQIRRDDTSREFPGLTLPARLAVLIDGDPDVDAPVEVVLSALDITTIVADIDAALGVTGTAKEEEGFVAIYSSTIGAGASVTIVPVSAGVDASFYLGFPRWPNPISRVESGDVAWTPPRGRVDNNPLGTGFIATGDQMAADAQNRGLMLLSANTESLYQTVTRELARGMEVDVDETDPNWAARIVTDGAGNIVQLDLSDLSPWPLLEERIYVGNGYVDRLSTLTEIGQFFAVMRNDLVEIIEGGEAVRVAGVHRGQRVAPTPDFVDETSPPTNPLIDVADWTTHDGSNVLGVDCIKTAAVPIDEIQNRCVVRVAGATFITDGVVDGDKAVVSGSTINDPFNHDGTYRVERVIDEEHLELGAWTPGDRAELNPDTSGAFGSVEVSSGGLFADGIWLTFEPAIPAGTLFKVVCGAAVTLANMPVDHFLRMNIRSFDEVDDLVQEVIRKMKGPLVDSTDDFTSAPFAHSIAGGSTYAGEPDVTQELQWRRTTLQGAYDGQGRGAGGGFMVEVDDRPPRWQVNSTRTPKPGTVLRTGTPGVPAQFLAGNIFFATGEAFTLDDVGRYILVRGALPAGLDPNATFKIIDYLDSESVIVSEETSAPGQIPVGSVEEYAIIEGRFEDWNAAMVWHVIEQVNPTARWGGVYFEDMNPYGDYDPGHALNALREAPQHSGDASILRYFDITFDGGDDWIRVPFDPTDSGNVRFGYDDDTGEYRPGGYIAITHSQENAGWYHVVQGEMGAGAGRLRLANLDGSKPNFAADATGEAKAHLYVATELSNETFDLTPIAASAGIRRIGKFFYEDGYDLDNLQGVVGIGWRGVGSGLWANLNDPSFKSIDRIPDATRGPAMRFTSYSPAYGLFNRHYGDPDNAGASYRGYWAMYMQALTRSLDQTKTGPMMRGGAGMLVQLGWDPGLFVLSKETGNTNFVSMDYPWLESAAAIVAAGENPQTQLQSGAHEFTGAMYQPDARMWSADHNDIHRGGIYSEQAGAFMHSLHPMMLPEDRYYEAAPVPLGAITRGQARLGWPGQIQPWGLTGDIQITGLLPPDPTKSRAIRTSGTVQFVVSDATIRLWEPFDRFIGCQVEISGSADDDGIYVIINAVPVDQAAMPDYTLELELLGTNTIAAPLTWADGDPAAPSLAVLGARWHYGYVDVAGFTLYGTETKVPYIVGKDFGSGGPGGGSGGGSSAGGPQPAPIELLRDRAPHEYPVIGARMNDTTTLLRGGDLINLTSPEPAWPAYGKFYHAPHSLAGMIDQPYGHGDSDIGEMITDPTSDWLAEEPFLNSGWCGAYGRMIAPAPPNFGPFLDDALSSRADNAMNFWNSEWVWTRNLIKNQTPSGTFYAGTGPGVGAALGDPWAMYFEYEHDPGVALYVPRNMYRALEKGQRLLRNHHYNVVVRFEARFETILGNIDQTEVEVIARLVSDNGTVHQMASVMVPVNAAAASKYEVHLNLGERLREANMMTFEEENDWRVEIGIGKITADAPLLIAQRGRLHLWQISVDQDHQVLVDQGSRVVEGTVSAQGFRALSPIRDYMVMGPGDAQLYLPPGYAAEPSIKATSDYVGLDLPIDPPAHFMLNCNYEKEDGEQHDHRAWCRVADFIDFRRGIDSASIRFLMKWTDPYVHYLSRTGGDPLGDEDTDGYAPPSRVGFIVPLRVPHGARIIGADLQMSFQPQFYDDGEDHKAKLTIWGDRRPFVGPGAEDDLVGCRIRIVRLHLFPDADEAVRRIGNEFSNDPSGGAFENGVHASVRCNFEDPWDAGLRHQDVGFYEVLFGSYMVLPEEPTYLPVNSAIRTNFVGHYGGALWNLPIGAEMFARRRYFFLTGQGGDDPDPEVVPFRHSKPEVWVADTRQFAYYAIIDAWGRGDVDTPHGDVLGKNGDAPDPAVDGPWLGSGMYSPYWMSLDRRKPEIPPTAMASWTKISQADEDKETYLRILRRSAAMKFRGLRMTYEWDRLRPG